jgi:CDP-diacylglycerol--serine O-phosphatidyltransferase
MNSKLKPLGYYNYTVILTYIGMLIGVVGIAYALEHSTCAAIICLMLAGFCDMFDGAIASTKERTVQEKNFGIQIDSLSDLICFGVLPAVITYSMNPHNNLILAVSALYALCALIRLAYFNVDEQERQKTSDSSREIYYGLPVTLSALFFPLVNAATKVFSWKTTIAPTVTLFVMAVLFLTPVPLKKPKLLGKICVLLCGIAEVFFVIFSLDFV